MDPQRWDERYSGPGFAYGTEPNDFLASVADRLPRGPVLTLGEGEGLQVVDGHNRRCGAEHRDRATRVMQEVDVMAACLRQHPRRFSRDPNPFRSAGKRAHHRGERPRQCGILLHERPHDEERDGEAIVGVIALRQRPKQASRVLLATSHHAGNEPEQVDTDMEPAMRAH